MLTQLTQYIQNMENIKVIPNGTNWQFISYSEDVITVFPSNAIMFFNDKNATANIIINDTYTLEPEDGIEFGLNQNEIDLTIWKIAFPTAGGKVNIAYKTDNNITLPEMIKRLQQANSGKVLERSRRNKGAQMPQRQLNRFSNLSRRRTISDF